MKAENLQDDNIYKLILGVYEAIHDSRKQLIYFNG